MSLDIAPDLSIVSTIPFRAFHNGLRVLRNLDADELVAAGVIQNQDEWLAFERDPSRFFTRADDERAAALWQLIQKRQPVALRADISSDDGRAA